MAFEKEPSRVPTSIGDITIILEDIPIIGETPASQSVQFRIAILDQDGSQIRMVSGDLMSHLTTAQKSALQKFLSDIRAKAEAEILAL